MGQGGCEEGDLPVPSSVTIPRPSALFCLSKALRSSTLGGEETEEQVNGAMGRAQTEFGPARRTWVTVSTEKKTERSIKRERIKERRLYCDLPAGLHECLDALEKSHIAFLLQILQHFLKTGRKLKCRGRRGSLASGSSRLTCICVCL